MSKTWRKLIPIPRADSINTVYSPASVRTMVEVFGAPVGTLGKDCKQRANTSPQIRPHIVTRSVGPFTLTGFGPFLDVLDRVFAEYKSRHPEAYADLSHAGVLCVRLVRGSAVQPSNHSWGTAIDLGFGWTTVTQANGRKVKYANVDVRGDRFTYSGLLDFYAIAKQHGLFWGAGFRTEDAMHFEASDELVRQWGRDLDL